SGKHSENRAVSSKEANDKIGSAGSFDAKERGPAIYPKSESARLSPDAPVLRKKLSGRPQRQAAIWKLSLGGAIGVVSSVLYLSAYFVPSDLFEDYPLVFGFTSFLTLVGAVLFVIGLVALFRKE